MEAFARQVAAGGEREAIWSRGEGLRLSFAALDERVEAWYQRLELPAGQPVALATGNSVDFCALFLALRRLGLPVVAMDGALAHREKEALCQRLGVATLLHADEAGEPLLGAVHHSAVAIGAPAQLPPDTALVKLSSGSTGDALGACFSEDCLHIGIQQIAAGMALSADDRVLIAIPLSHSYGFDNGVLSLIVVGTPLVLEPSYYPAAVIRALAEGKASFLPLVPPLVRCLGQAEWPRQLPLQRMICAGGALVPAFAEQLHRACGRPVHNFYGSTETGGIAFEDDPLAPEAVGTVGKPLPGVEIELDAAGRVGVVSKANLIGRLGCAQQPPRRWLTGDTAVWSGERLRLTGRSADILNIGGRKIAAAVVEDALRELPAVEEAAVVGIEDALRGDRVVAFLVAREWPVDISALPPRLMPRELRRITALPHNERGKLDRAYLRQLVADAGRG